MGSKDRWRNGKRRCLKRKGGNNGHRNKGGREGKKEERWGGGWHLPRPANLGKSFLKE